MSVKSVEPNTDERVSFAQKFDFFFLNLQNFHLIDYNMLAFTVIILARRLIAAIVKEVRSDTGFV